MVSILGVKRENGDVAAEMAEHEKRITSKNAIKLSLWKTKFWKLSRSRTTIKRRYKKQYCNEDIKAGFAFLTFDPGG